MAILTITVPPEDVPDALAAVEQIWAGEAARLFYGGIAADYDAAPAAARAKACVGAWLTVTTRNYRTAQNQAAVLTGVEPAIS